MSFLPIIQALKGSSSSGNFGHAGRKGKRGGSAPGKGGGGSGKYSTTEISKTLPWVTSFNELVAKRGLQQPLIDDEFTHFTQIEKGVKREKLRAEGGFGLCALHSLNGCQQNPNLDIAVGLYITDYEAKAVKNFDSQKYWTMPFLGIVHVWNVDKKTGKVVDRGQGSGDGIYLGKIVDASKFQSDDQLLNHAHKFIDSKFPTDFRTQDAEYEKWAKGRE